jgi:pyridoxamine 5'-phosphate oxidase family protein
MFTEKERAYLRSQRLARLATVSPSGQPDADVVGFELDGDDILIGSYQNLAGSRKYKNVAADGQKVSLIVDSLASVDPMDPVAVKIHGTALIEQRNGRFGPMEYIVVRPRTT